MNTEDFKLNTRKPQLFRVFVNEMWMQHKDELLEWEGELPNYTSRDYFLKYRWQLRKLYQQHKEQSWDRGKKNVK